MLILPELLWYLVETLGSLPYFYAEIQRQYTSSIAESIDTAMIVWLRAAMETTS